jgi:GntR family transcriptional regulator
VYYLTIALIQRDWSDRMEYNTASPIYLQVINELKKRMVKGELKPGEKMPSNRELAVLFKVNQNTAARIYREMESMGLCYTKRGIGTFVSEEDDMISGLKKEMAEELVRNFMQEMEDLGFQKGDIIDRIADYKEEEK